jgi:tripartite-type tricarboxylate transporter receptor subunit TctC
VGSGAHFAVELLKAQAGIDLVHVPLKGIPEGLNETIAGRTQLFISPYASAIQLVKEGKARAIAVTSTQRMPGARSSAETKCISEVPGLAKQTSTSPSRRVCTIASEPFIALLLRFYF